MKTTNAQDKSRPSTLVDVALRTLSKQGAFDANLREFLDEFYSKKEKRSGMIAEPPPSIDEIKDAYLGAAAEHLAIHWKLDRPRWINDPSRFLRRPYFAGGLENLKAILLVESPAAFRRRMIFVGKDALFRPRAVDAEA